MTPDRARLEARATAELVALEVARGMAERLRLEAHDRAHAAMSARLMTGWGRARRPITGDTGSSVLLLVAAVPCLALVVLFVAQLAGALAGVVDGIAGGVA